MNYLIFTVDMARESAVGLVTMISWTLDYMVTQGGWPW